MKTMPSLPAGPGLIKVVSSKLSARAGERKLEVIAITSTILMGLSDGREDLVWTVECIFVSSLFNSHSGSGTVHVAHY